MKSIQMFKKRKHFKTTSRRFSGEAKVTGSLNNPKLTLTPNTSSNPDPNLNFPHIIYCH